MWKKILLLSLTSLLVSEAPLSKETKTEERPVNVELRFEPSLHRVDEKVSKLIGEAQQQTLRQLAEAAVISDFCSTVNLDQNAFKKSFETLTTALPKQSNPDLQRDLENKLMTYFGMYVGLLVAEGTDRHPEFCELAARLQTEKRPLSRYWLPTTQSPVNP
ncbi:MAG: hypothetical protein EBT06_11440 [Gammaproteobacteria bacterium]|nr:hypothetical protein [Gammaproteobacteria bacterium]NBY21831.1 hypothetical protein [Gammaproteobacteria bacterium]NDE34005.1 hypothetical protein [Gammaproteobacteria bacterium]NDE55907.1 hypothetical protein [Gammaproteobacteria bacterium]NDG86901.1 hypothetical protein [Gammaproteobacteria bacterium]